MAEGFYGTVEKVEAFTTLNNKAVIIPNANMIQILGISAHY